MGRKKEEFALEGAPISAGIAIGVPFLFEVHEDDIPNFTVDVKDVESEVTRFKQAVERSEKDLFALRRQLAKEDADEAADILETHLQILRDPLMSSDIEKAIRSTRKNSEHIFQRAILEYEEKFNKISDSFFRERFKDIEDIARRVMGYLRKSVRVSLAEIPPNSIIFAHELAPSDAAEAKSSKVCAFVTQQGGEASHAAIMARARGIPFVGNIDLQALEKGAGKQVIVDGRSGRVIINPSKATLKHYEKIQQKLQVHFNKLERMGKLATQTIDGYSVRLSANIEDNEEIPFLHKYKAHGVGLYRSEYILRVGDTFPSEEEQFKAYSSIAKKMKKLPLVIRTFDVGGDKFCDFQAKYEEKNPFLGCRAIRFLLKEPEIFKSQLRAILRASAFGILKQLYNSCSRPGM